MSEYQYYEFQAVDRPLDAAQRAEVRALSTRATITATDFVNVYEWGDFKGDPAEMMERYYDAHLYVNNWGTHRLMLRLPSDEFDVDTAEDYLVDDLVDAWATDSHVVLDLANEDTEFDFEFDTDPAERLPDLLALRDELAEGDLRPLYLAWLSAYGTWERDETAFDRSADDDPEPPVPAGLTDLTAPQLALANLLRVDPVLLAVAVEASPASGPPTRSGRTVATLLDAAARLRPYR